jgi:hypothetical protein
MVGIPIKVERKLVGLHVGVFVFPIGIQHRLLQPHELEPTGFGLKQKNARLVRQEKNGRLGMGYTWSEGNA